jgi:hypothetical protein
MILHFLTPFVSVVHAMDGRVIASRSPSQPERREVSTPDPHKVRPGTQESLAMEMCERLKAYVGPLGAEVESVVTV